MSDSIPNWLDKTLEDSQYEWSFWERQELDDTFGWGAKTDFMLVRMKGRMGLEKENSARSCGLLLTGPEGCGKHTAAIHMMKHLREEGYTNLFLSGDSLGENAAEVIERMEALLTHFLEAGGGDGQSGGNVCILLENMEHSPCRREVLNYFGQQLQNYWISTHIPSLFLILIDNQEADIPARLRSRLILCRMSLPTKTQRAALLKRYASDLRDILSLECFADVTAGATYAQLLDMICATAWRVGSMDAFSKLSDDDLREFLDGQMPPPTPQDDMHDLVIAARELTVQLPAILERAGNVAVMQNVVAAPVQQASETQTSLGNEEAIKEQKRKELYDMSPIQLSSMLFTEEEQQQIFSGVMESQAIPS